MQKFLQNLIVLIALGTVAACGGDDEGFNQQPTDPVDPTAPPPPAELASLDIVTNNPQIPSDGGIPATVTAFLKDLNNNFVASEDIIFAADSGGLNVTQPTTDENGQAVATLSTAGDPTNRTITVTASIGELSDTVVIQVTGSQLTVSGPDSLVQGDKATYTFVLADAAGNGIPGQVVDVTSSNGNTISATSLTTDPTGQAQVELEAVNGGQDQLRGASLGLSATRVIEVSDDSFAFSTPSANSEISLNATRTIRVNWVKDGAPQSGQTVTFSTTRGAFVGLIGPPVVTTDGDGNAEIQITSDNAGPAVVTADASGGPSTQLALEFIATIPSRVELQADPFTIAPNNQTTVTAVVRDAENNRVKNARVSFSLTDVTGGTLSVGAAETDSQGRAQTFYTASDTQSGNLGVQVKGFIEGVNPDFCATDDLCDEVALTVARRELFVAFGTGNELVEPDIASYEVPYLVIVTDSEGNGVPEANVQLDVRTVRYVKGTWVPGFDFWTTLPTVTCDDEDLNGNGILDPDEVDINNNGTIEGGNVVEIVGGDVLTDSEGKATITLRYAQVYGAWTEVRLRAQVSVGGTEFSEDLSFLLTVTSDDVELDQSPPGLLRPPDPAAGFNGNFLASPWGYSSDCALDF